MDSETIQVKKKRMVYETLRWVMSIMLMFFALSKMTQLMSHGLKPYDVFVETLGWPTLFRYYGVMAIIIEVYTAISLWIRRTYTSGLALMFVLTLAGVGLGVYSFYYKLNSDCGCGLFGENETFIFVQKLIVLVLLLVLYKGRQLLFDSQSGA